MSELINDIKSNLKPLTSDSFAETMVLNEAKDIKKRANVLHVLEGACMEMDAVNRNNRIYPKELVVKKILNNDATNDLMKKNCLFGEGCHPETRLETIVPNICISVEKLWIPKEDPSKLYGRFAVLDTPTGRIVNTLLEYGAKIGVSARASGTSTFTPEGYELLNVDDYEFYTFDVVTEPGFACARPNLVESKSKSILNEYKTYSKNELSGIKNIIEQYPSFFKTEISAVNSLMNENNQSNEPQHAESVLKETEIENLKKEISRLNNENEKLRKINRKKHIKEQAEISKLSKQIDVLKYHFKECTKANKTLEQKNKTLIALTESQRQSLNDKKNIKANIVKESLNKKIKAINNKKTYEENVKLIASKTSMNESIVKKYYKSINDNVDQTIDSIKKLTPYLNETKKPVKVINANESKSLQQQIEQTDEFESGVNTQNFLEGLIC